MALLPPYLLQEILADNVFDGVARGYLVIVWWVIVWVLAYNTSSGVLYAKFIGRYLSLYLDACNPKGFLLSSAHIFNKMKQPYDSWSVWYLSHCCLAYYDCDNKLIAEEILRNMLDDIVKTKEGYIKALKELYLFSPLATLMDVRIALKHLDEAEAYFYQNPRKHAKNLFFISFQRKLAYAKEAGKSHEIITILQQMISYENNSLRTKVIVAYRQSEQYQKLGDMNKERELLTYVVTYGPKLSVGRKARERLEVLGEFVQRETQNDAPFVKFSSCII